MNWAQQTMCFHQQTAAFRPEKFTSVFSCSENTSLDDGCSLAVWTYSWLTCSIIWALWDWKEWAECQDAFIFFQCVWIFLKLLWVCALGFTLSTRLPHIIFKCFDHACNGVFISSIKNVSYMLLWLKCFWKSGYSLNLKPKHFRLLFCASYLCENCRLQLLSLYIMISISDETGGKSKLECTLRLTCCLPEGKADHGYTQGRSFLIAKMKHSPFDCINEWKQV